MSFGVRIIFVLLLIAIPLSGYADGLEPPIPRPAKAGQEQARGTAPNQKPAAAKSNPQNPRPPSQSLKVKKTADNSAENAGKCGNCPANDWWSIIYGGLTLLVLAVQVAVYWWIACIMRGQGDIMNKQLAATQSAADAAHKSAEIARDALVRVEGPYLEIKTGAGYSLHHTTGAQFPRILQLDLESKNIGRTIAIPISLAWYQTTKQHLIAGTVAGDPETIAYEPESIWPQKPGPEKKKRIEGISQTEWDSWAIEGNAPGFFCEIVAEDAIGNIHRIGIGRAYDPKTNTLHRCGSRYNFYDVKEKKDQAHA